MTLGLYMDDGGTAPHSKERTAAGRRSLLLFEG